MTMKIVLMALSMFMAWQGIGQNQLKGNFIAYSDDYQLTWDDFQARPKRASDAAALSDISFTVDIKSENEDLVVFIQTAFNKEGSWVKPDDKTDYLLKHEQSHFDLYEVNARKMREELQKQKLTVHNVQNVVNDLMQKYNDINHESQLQYDDETSHSLREGNQEIWNKRIEKDLEKYKEFASPTFRVKVRMN